MSDDDLVYDGELGWIDPGDPLGSIGVDVKVSHGRFWITYQDSEHGGPFHGHKYKFPMDRDSLVILNRCIEDAILRGKE